MSRGCITQGRHRRSADRWHSRFVAAYSMDEALTERRPRGCRAEGGEGALPGSSERVRGYFPWWPVEPGWDGCHRRQSPAAPRSQLRPSRPSRSRRLIRGGFLPPVAISATNRSIRSSSCSQILLGAFALGSRASTRDGRTGLRARRADVRKSLRPGDSPRASAPASRRAVRGGVGFGRSSRSGPGLPRALDG